MASSCHHFRSQVELGFSPPALWFYRVKSKHVPEAQDELLSLGDALPIRPQPLSGPSTSFTSQGVVHLEQLPFWLCRG